MAKKSWKEKLHNKKDQLPEIKEIDCEKLIARTGKGKMVIPAPLEIDALMKQVPEGFLITTDQIREYFNEKYHAVYTCPLCTGIFSRIAACAAEEDQMAGKKDFTPYWRTLKTNGEINEKFPGGIEGQVQLLEQEGHSIIRKGKKYFVKDVGAAQFVL
ncbi:MAG: MGMT family protein [Bacteroidetes bacterium]|nr:MGMT family protein [Bacteroidota bacterium]MBU1719340.1 MGMT family protein [Bacteroidota bacterium]